MLIDITKLDAQKTCVTLHKVKTDQGQVAYIFKSLFGTSYMYQFDTKQEAREYAKKNNFKIVNE